MINVSPSCFSRDGGGVGVGRGLQNVKYILLIAGTALDKRTEPRGSEHGTCKYWCAGFSFLTQFVRGLLDLGS